MARGLLLCILASAAAFGLSPAPAFAGSFSVSPLRVELSAGAATGALTIRNRASEPVVVQAEALLWEQQDGEDRLTPTRDLLVSPAVFTLAGEGSQLLRVALRRAPDAGRQLSYRLLLTEVPAQSGEGSSGLSVALRLSLPVFIAPASGSAEPDIEWSLARAGDGMTLTARNAGNAHARVLSFTAAVEDGPGEALDQRVAAYILPGQARSWPLGGAEGVAKAAAEGRRLRVKGAAEAGDFDVVVALDEP
jgi:fimbrial chaperone protein